MIVSEKILITGGNGMVGHYFTNVPNCVVLGRDEFDITKPAMMAKAIKKYQPKAIIHLAALTDVDLAQKKPELAYKTNTIGTYNVAVLAKKYGIHLVYVSTGSVFSGRSKKPYTIKSQPMPLNVYAESKKLGEDIVKNVCKEFSIVRTGWVFGGFERDKKFVALIAKQVWDGKKEIKAISDTFGCPTYAKDLAEAILTLIENEQFGIFHAVNKGHASRYLISKQIVKALGEKVKVKTASSKDFPNFGAPRPTFEVIEQNLPLRTWQSALREYLLDWQKLRFPELFITPLLNVSNTSLEYQNAQRGKQQKVAAKY
jgi:dTDP-4-dehydrorhamnose reductase